MLLLRLRLAALYRWRISAIDRRLAVLRRQHLQDPAVHAGGISKAMEFDALATSRAVLEHRLHGNSGWPVRNPPP